MLTTVEARSIYFSIQMNFRKPTVRKHWELISQLVDVKCKKKRMIWFYRKAKYYY